MLVADLLGKLRCLNQGKRLVIDDDSIDLVFDRCNPSAHVLLVPP